MPQNDRKWAREWNACRNCETTRRPHEARGYCSYCYRLIRQLAKICSWTEKDFPDLAWSSPRFVNNNIDQIKDACKAQVNIHLGRVHAIEKKLNGPIYGIDIEFQLARIARKIRVSSRGNKARSLYHGIAGYIDDNFDATQRQILYRLLNKIEDQTRKVGIDWNAVWKKVYGE
jgi:hypothetical protein